MEKLLTINDLSEFLQVSPSTIYHWTHTDYIPHYKLPKGVRFRSEEVINWLKRKRIKGREKYTIDIS